MGLEHGYFHVPTHPECWKHLGIRWGGEYLVFVKMCFGLSNAPACFHRFGGALVRWARKVGVRALIYYLDDFWGYAPN